MLIFFCLPCLAEIFLLYFFFRLLFLLHSALPSSLVVFLILFFFLIKTISSLFSQFSSSNLLILLPSLHRCHLPISLPLFSRFLLFFLVTLFFKTCPLYLFLFLLLAQINHLRTLFDSSFSLIFIFFICVLI